MRKRKRDLRCARAVMASSSERERGEASSLPQTRKDSHTQKKKFFLSLKSSSHLLVATKRKEEKAEKPLLISFKLSVHIFLELSIAFKETSYQHNTR